jgi:hypothetical protein
MLHPNFREHLIGEVRRRSPLPRTPVNPWLTEPRYGPFSAVKQVFPAQLFNACRRDTRFDGGAVDL